MVRMHFHASQHKMIPKFENRRTNVNDEYLDHPLDVNTADNTEHVNEMILTTC